jgi:hypothetical protein
MWADAARTRCAGGHGASAQACATLRRQEEAPTCAGACRTTRRTAWPTSGESLQRTSALAFFLRTRTRCVARAPPARHAPQQARGALAAMQRADTRQQRRILLQGARCAAPRVALSPTRRHVVIVVRGAWMHTASPRARPARQRNRTAASPHAAPTQGTLISRCRLEGAPTAPPWAARRWTAAPPAGTPPRQHHPYRQRRRLQRRKQQGTCLEDEGGAAGDLGRRPVGAVAQIAGDLRAT